MLTTWDWVALALSAVLCLWATVSRRNAATEEIHAPWLQKWTRGRIQTDTLIALGIVVIGCALRITQMIIARDALVPEELWTAMQARSLWQTGKSLEGLRFPAVLPGWGGEANGPLLVWLTAPVLALTGSVALSVRVHALIWQVAAMLAVWDVLRRTGARRVALWALLILAVAPWQLMAARWALAWQMPTYMSVVALWLLSVPRGKPAAILGAMGVLALAMYSGDAAWYVVPLFVLLASVILLWHKAVRARVVLAAVAVFVVLALPALVSCAVQTLRLPATSVYGMQVPALEKYTHHTDWLTQQPKDVISHYSSDAIMPKQEGYGPQIAPFLRDNAQVATLHTDLLSAFYGLMKQIPFQHPDDPGYTAAYLLPEFGNYYVFSAPLALLGMLWLLTRGKGKQSGEPGKRLTGALWGAWALSAAVLALTHTMLTPPHYAALLYPLALCMACGAYYVSRKVRFSGAALVAMCVLGLISFQQHGYNPAPTFPGLMPALRNVAAENPRQVFVTTRLYPHDAPDAAAALNTMWAFDLPLAYVRAEQELPGELPYKERFQYVYFPSYTMDPQISAAYILHSAEIDSIDTTPFDVQTFGEFYVLRPMGGV